METTEMTHEPKCLSIEMLQTITELDAKELRRTMGGAGRADRFAPLASEWD